MPSLERRIVNILVFAFCTAGALCLLNHAIHWARPQPIPTGRLSVVDVSMLYPVNNSRVYNNFYQW